MIKKNNVSLTKEQHALIYEHKRVHAKITNEELAQWAKEQFKLNDAPSKTTISKSLKRSRENGPVVESKKKRTTVGRYPQIDEAVALWVNIAENNGIPISWNLIREKALRFAESLHISDFKASNGWMHRFAARKSLKMYRIHGESGSAEGAILELDRSRVAAVLSKYYSKKDIYNFDETALFYAAPPRTTIAVSGFMGPKETKKRLTVGLICNADGSDKWFEPLTIGHANKPKCFNIQGKPKNAGDHGFQLYFNNENAWMTKAIFKVFLRRFDNAMRYNGRKVLLVLDNFAGHMVDYEPSNVELLFLPPNTTSRVQPLDGGIIRAFKAHFKRMQFSRAYRAVSLIQIGRPDLAGPLDKIFEVDQLQAMKWIKAAWNNVTEDTIKNCWDATFFHEFNSLHEAVDVNVQAHEHITIHEKEMSDTLQQSIADITSTGIVNVEDCPIDEVDPEYERNAVHRIIVTEEDIVELILEGEVEDENEFGDEAVFNESQLIEEAPVKRIYSSKEKLELISQVLDFIDEEDEYDPVIMEKLEKIRRKYIKASTSVQSKMTSFFQFVDKQ